jgi:aminopeptidase YwaD
MSSFLRGALALVAAFTLACSGDTPGNTAASATPDPPGSAVTDGSTAALPAPSKPDPDRVLAHVKALAADIGVRAAGTDGERRAADYIAQALKDTGYQVAIEPFTFGLRYDTSTVRFGETTVKALALTGSPEATASGVLVMAGTGRPEDFSLRDVRGKVVIVDRGGVPFGQKAANAQGAGATGLIVVNNEEGQFRGTLGDGRFTIPVIGVERAERGRLMTVAQAAGSVTVTAAAGSRQTTSQNVVGRSRERCEYYLGAHYDSVPEGPGANDNASGTAMILELARSMPRPGMCIIAFGAEEYGLWGSQAFVKAHGTQGMKFLLNFDMVGKVTGAEIVGDTSLQEKILNLLKQAGKSGFRAGQFPPFASSDHASFTSAGVPAVTFYSGNDDLIHQPGDTLANVDRGSIETMLTAAELAITGLVPR